jgi:cation:H+ antiporter
MILLWIPALVVGIVFAVLGSRRTLVAARALAVRLGMSPFMIGMTVVAFGTDLPEIANSIIASATDHGDLNVGDSIGSVVTQLTLVLGILCFIGTIRSERRLVGIAGSVTVVAVLLGAMLLDDGFLSRSDGLILLAFWLVGTLAVQRVGHVELPRQDELFGRGSLSIIRDLVVGLSAVAAGAVVVVLAFSALADSLGVPEYATSFLVLSIGTSLPELFIDGSAIRKGDTGLAMGDIVGSSFVDATISLGIGPALFPVAVSSSAARGSVFAAAIVAAVIAILLLRRTHDRLTGVALFGLYVVAYLVIIL